MSLRGKILLALGIVVFALSAILWPSGNPAPHASSGPATAPSPTASASAESAPSAKLVDAANPAQLLDEADFTKVSTTTFKRTSDAVPTSGKYYNERSAVFTSQDKEYAPNSDKKPVTLTIVTYIDDTSGTYFKELVTEAKAHSEHYGGIYTPEGDAGADAFLSHTGTLTTHKGRVIVRLIGHDEGRTVLNDSTITTLAIQALRRLDVTN
jgi:hypothetical protein